MAWSLGRGDQPPDCVPRRSMALASLLIGTAPIWFSVGHVLMAIRPRFDRHVPPGWPTQVLLSPGRSLADLEATGSTGADAREMGDDGRGYIHDARAGGSDRSAR